MSEEKYKKYSEEKYEMILRDYLAVDRTIMSNEGSFLAYIRTALTLLIAAITFLKFLDSVVFDIIGWALIVSAALLVLHGANRYDTMEKILDHLTGDMKNHPNAVHAGLAKRMLIASQSLLKIFR